MKNSCEGVILFPSLVILTLSAAKGKNPFPFALKLTLARHPLWDKSIP